MTPYARPEDRYQFLRYPDGMWHSRCIGCGPAFNLISLKHREQWRA